MVVPVRLRTTTALEAVLEEQPVVCVEGGGAAPGLAQLPNGLNWVETPLRGPNRAFNTDNAHLVLERFVPRPPGSETVPTDSRIYRRLGNKVIPVLMPEE
jgi:hypothetical protein